MANLYGVASPNPPAQGLQTIGSGNVPCPAGVETNITSGQATLPMSQGWYYPIISGWITLAFTATPPTALAVGFRLNNGADLQNYFYYPATFPASLAVCLPFSFLQDLITFAYPIGTINFQVTINSGTNACTAMNAGSLFWAQWIRAPDQ